MTEAGTLSDCDAFAELLSSVPTASLHDDALAARYMDVYDTRFLQRPAFVRVARKGGRHLLFASRPLARISIGGCVYDSTDGGIPPLRVVDSVRVEDTFDGHVMSLSMRVLNGVCSFPYVLLQGLGESRFALTELEKDGRVVARTSDGWKHVCMNSTSHPDGGYVVLPGESFADILLQTSTTPNNSQHGNAIMIPVLTYSQEFLAWMPFTFAIVALRAITKGEQVRLVRNLKRGGRCGRRTERCDETDVCIPRTVFDLRLTTSEITCKRCGFVWKQGSILEHMAKFRQRDCGRKRRRAYGNGDVERKDAEFISCRDVQNSICYQGSRAGMPRFYLSEEENCLRQRVKDHQVSLSLLPVSQQRQLDEERDDGLSITGASDAEALDDYASQVPDDNIDDINNVENELEDLLSEPDVHEGVWSSFNEYEQRILYESLKLEDDDEA